MTKTYHDIDAVTRLLQEKEKDLELAAKIGQELLERNRILDERAASLEYQVSSSSELITQLRHELAIKTDLLHVYSSDAAEESSPLELRNISVELLQKKIKVLEDENKKLHEEASELAKEAIACEEKEERLVSDAVKHLTEANVQINQLSEEFSVKSNESSKQKEEIGHLFAQVCDLQAKVKRYKTENEELSSQLSVYKVTQDELTTELADFKEKYREVVELLNDTRDELKKAKKRTYPGIGQHNVSAMFSSPSDGSTPDPSKRGRGSENSLQYEIQDSVRLSRKSSKRSFRGDSTDPESHDFKRAFNTYKIVTSNKMLRSGGRDTASPLPMARGYQPGQGSSLDNSVGNKSLEELFPDGSIRYLPNESTYSYTISRENSSTSMDLFDLSDEFIDYSGYRSDAAPLSRGKNCLEIETRPSDTLTVSSSKLQVCHQSQMPNLDVALNPEEGFVGKLTVVGIDQEEEDDQSNSRFGECEIGELKLRSFEGTPISGHPGIGTFGSLGRLPELGGHPGIGQFPKSGEIVETTGWESDYSEGGPIEFLGSRPFIGELGPPRGHSSIGELRPPLGHPGIGELGPPRGHPGIGQIGPRPEFPGQMGLSRGHPGLGMPPPSWVPPEVPNEPEVIRVKTVGVLQPPSMSGSSRPLALAMPLGSVPGQDDEDSLRLYRQELANQANDKGDSLADREMSELEFTLQNLNPSEVERRRRMFKQQTQYSYELGSDGFGSPGSLVGKPGFHFLPYGVRTPDSIMSTGSRDWLGSAGGSSGFGAGWKLPDKLRIVKPLEGSLTLHNWSRLAVPSLGGIFEEHSGVAVKGAVYPHYGGKNQEKAFDMQPFSDLDDMDLDMDSDCFEGGGFRRDGDTTTLLTLTNTRILHPIDDHTLLTQSYKGAQFSSGFMSNSNSRSQSALMSRATSQMSLLESDAIEFNRMRKSQATTTYSTNIGLARILNERNIYGGSTLSIDKWSAPQSDVASVCSLTPSVISSPKGDRAFTPTGTPLNSPAVTPPGTPPNEPSSKQTDSASSGIVVGFFSSLRAALYGEQQKEAQAQLLRAKRKKRKPVITKRLGILEKVEEVGVERFLSASPAPSSLDDEQRNNDNFWASLSKPHGKNWKPDLLSDELEEIEPGTLTVSRGGSDKPRPPKQKEPLVGQLKPPVFSVFAPPDMSPNELGKLPLVMPGTDHQKGFPPGGSSVGGRGPGRVISPCEKRPFLPGVGLGVPGHPGTGALRNDLGFVPVTSATFNQNPRSRSSAEPESGTGFIGSIAQMFFGRKGGLF